MIPPIPYLDVQGYKRRSKVPPGDIDWCESLFPGYLAHRIARGSSLINARLKKRYVVPLGQAAPPLIAAGTAPPAVALTGRPAVGSLEVQILIDGAGALGTATFRWSVDGGQTFAATAVPTAATVALSAAGVTTGLIAAFPAGPYATDNAFTAPAPAPEIALGWLVAMLDVDLWQKRGVNPQDPSIAMGIEERNAALEELKEAADSKDGLFDLPTIDTAGDSAVTQGGPLSYSEQSPYVWADLQRCGGRQDDANRSGDSGSADE